jgi:hypothetical protein
MPYAKVVVVRSRQARFDTILLKFLIYRAGISDNIKQYPEQLFGCAN